MTESLPHASIARQKGHTRDSTGMEEHSPCEGRRNGVSSPDSSDGCRGLRIRGSVRIAGRCVSLAGRRMIRREVLIEIRRGRLGDDWFVPGKAGRVRLACRNYVNPTAPSTLGSKIALYIALLDEGHRNSTRSVSCLKGARPKRCKECRRREGEKLLLPCSVRPISCPCRPVHPS